MVWRLLGRVEDTKGYGYESDTAFYLGKNNIDLFSCFLFLLFFSMFEELHLAGHLPRNG